MDDNKKDHLNFIKNETKLLLIDEIEKEFSIDDTSRFMGSQVNDFFSHVYDSQKSLIVTSNVPKEELRKVHAFNIIDRLQELIDIVFVGESFRGSGNALQKLFGN
jgi:DNA replication protein DnaC